MRVSILVAFLVFIMNYAISSVFGGCYTPCISRSREVSEKSIEELIDQVILEVKNTEVYATTDKLFRALCEQPVCAIHSTRLDTPRNTRWWHILTIPISFPISICIISDFHVEFGFIVEPVIFSTTTFITTSIISSNSMESCSSSTVTIGFKPIYFYAPLVTISITITIKNYQYNRLD